MSIAKLKQTLRVLPLLGWGNALFVFVYRFMLKTGLKRFAFPPAEPVSGPFFPEPPKEPASDLLGDHEDLLGEVENLHRGSLRFFSHSSRQMGSPPQWFAGLENTSFPHWTRVGEFAGGIDIKEVWEPSRFDWTHKLARAWKISGEDRHLQLLEDWLADWSQANPLNMGPNWKCGQETSLRIFNLLLTHHFLGHDAPSPNLSKLLAQHCRRVEGNIGYAFAQDNNHGTSETAALLLAGGLLAGKVKEAERWFRLGFRRFQERLQRLVLADGSFAQASTNYHRVLLDTLSLVLFFQKQWCLPAFDTKTNVRMEAAVKWLFQMTDPDSGQVPNLGGNDGARLLPFGPYRDYRPSVQLATSLVFGHTAYPRGQASGILTWFGLNPEVTEKTWERGTSCYAQGGYITLADGLTWAMVRAPYYRFRPPHADGLHLDLWHRGHNILRDAGSCSYFHVAQNTRFSGTSAHNTVTCDGRDQMPRLSRFLFCDWLRFPPDPPRLEHDATYWEGEFLDSWGCRHRRSITFSEGRITVRDTLSGYRQEACLRWHLIPADWNLKDGLCSAWVGQIQVACEQGLVAISLERETESLYYTEASDQPVLVVRAEARPELVLTTRIKLSSSY